MKKHFSTILIVLLLIAGLSLLLYPTVSDYWNSFQQTRAIKAYHKAVSNLNEEEYEQILKQAEEYNARIAQNGIKWKLSDAEYGEYLSMLNVSGNGIMGYIDIGSINVKLPIYHGTEDTILRSATGHIEGSSLPVGGTSAHCVISGQRGLASARLFTDLDQLSEGDVFTMHILNESRSYQVDQIRIVLPEDISNLQVEYGKDYCTLVTGTPYGVNSHRLLVRGKRIDSIENVQIIEDAKQIKAIYPAGILVGVIVFLLFVGVMLRYRR